MQAFRSLNQIIAGEASPALLEQITVPISSIADHGLGSETSNPHLPHPIRYTTKMRMRGALIVPRDTNGSLRIIGKAPTKFKSLRHNECITTIIKAQT